MKCSFEIHPGLYIRTKCGVITKVLKINTTGSLTCDRVPNGLGGGLGYNNKILSNLEQIKNVSDYATDLLEVGDMITTNNLAGEITKIDGDTLYTTCYDGETCHKQDVKTIVTKEQFARMEYRAYEKKDR